MNSNSLSLVVFVLLTYFGVLPIAQAVVPPPDGGYPGFNTAEGQKALFNLTTGAGNTAVGWFSLESVTDGSWNTGVGAGTLGLNNGDQNTATGAAALLLNTTGAFNTANGALALLNNTIGLFDTATGVSALESNTTGTFNTANGVQALFLNTTGDANTATGGLALSSNTTGGSNTANGVEALLNNAIGSQNTADGADALRDNTSGNFNTATGFQALANNTTGSGNTALGALAGLGVTTADNVIAIAVNGANVSNSCFIGNIRGVTTQNANAIPVLIDSAGQLGTMSSSRRFKKEIKPMESASGAILGLKPVTFEYKSDKTDTPQFGLIAEEVAAVNPDLVVRDEKGEIYSVRYDAVNAMLLNEFLKEHRKVEKLEALVAQQRKDFEAALTDLKGQIQRVSAVLELNKAAQQVVVHKP